MPEESFSGLIDLGRIRCKNATRLTVVKLR